MTRKDVIVPHASGCRAEGADRRGPVAFASSAADKAYAKLCRDAIMRHVWKIFR